MQSRRPQGTLGAGLKRRRSAPDCSTIKDIIMNATDKAFDNIATIGKDTRADLHNAIDRAADKAQPTADRLASSAHASVDKVGDTYDTVTGAVVQRKAQVVDAYHRVADSSHRAADSGRAFVRDRPATSLLIAVAAGFTLSKLFSASK
jgi:ElaB/YqjD/DUF883 family membrane-anchored ribosome-binding protein